MAGTPLTDAINALTTYANTVTSKTPPDTTLSDAVATLASGYGGGGWTTDGIATGAEPNGAIVLGSSVTEIYAGAFSQKPITSIVGAAVTRIGDSAFRYCSSLTSIDFPKATTNLSAANYLFANCTNLLTANLPLLRSTGSNLFLSCSKLTSVTIPSAISVAQSSFQRCSVLPMIDLGENCASIAASGFAYCYALETIVLRRTSAIVSLANVNAFTDTPIRGYNSLTAEIYIPKALYDHLGDGTALDYEHASNWSSIYNEGHVTFKKIEGSIYEL